MLTLAILIAGAATLLVTAALVHYSLYRGKRIVVCPETGKPVGAEIDALEAACTRLAGQPHYIISSCSRWPERAGCNQACAPQIAASPRETLVRNIVLRWYNERSCSYCGQNIAEIGGLVTPGLHSMDGQLHEWKDVAPEDLPRLFAQSEAVCARCELVESFRHDFPERVLEKPAVTTARQSPQPLHCDAVY